MYNNIYIYIAGTMPPSQRRSIFTLAISMILFSSKSYNLAPVVHSAKAVLTEKNVSRFLISSLLAIIKTIVVGLNEKNLISIKVQILNILDGKNYIGRAILN